MPHTDLAISGKAAAVTAAATGIGRQIVEHLLTSDVNVAINDVDADALADTEEELADASGQVISIAGDASDPEDMTNFIETAVDEFDGLDILVNNVGIAGPTQPCKEIDFEDFMNTLKINLGGQFNATQAAIPFLRESNAGRIVNISSMSGKRPLQDRTPYVTTKMGIIGFTRTLAVELAKDDVTVNAVCPGSVEGPRLKAVIKSQAKRQDRPYEEVEAEFQSVSPMNRFVQATDVADTVLFLCSEQAKQITGQDLNVTAGIVQY